jgi:hypothetical protein
VLKKFTASTAVNFFLKSATVSGIQSIAATEYYDTSTVIMNKIFGQYVFRLTSAS